VFNFFKSKKPQHKKYDFDLLEVKNEVFKFFEKKFPKDLELARTEFVRLTGPFDEEHEYFESKLDDFRNWFLFFYGHKNSTKLESIKDFPEISGYYEYLASGTFSIFYVSSVKSNFLFLKDLFTGENYKVKDETLSLSLVKGDSVQTSLYYKSESVFEFGLGVITHPPESLPYIKRKIKDMEQARKKDLAYLSKEEFFENLMSMRYQFFKYKQLKVKQIY